MHNFKNSLAIGKAGEATFIALAAAVGIDLVGTDGRKGDTIGPGGHKWEIKTDSYDMLKTGNFFIETWSDLDNLKPGGPTQALLHDCKYFAYYFSLNKQAFVFDTADLCLQLQNVPLGRPRYIKNARWTTVGYAVPRSLLKHLYTIDSKGITHPSTAKLSLVTNE